MAEKRPYRSKVILTQNLLPNVAEPGSVFVCKDTGEAWIAVRPHGHLMNLHDLLDGRVEGGIREPGPQGLPGRDGADGKDGRDGVDLTSNALEAAINKLRDQYNGLVKQVADFQALYEGMVSARIDADQRRARAIEQLAARARRT
jgi:hypothetical protein